MSLFAPLERVFEIAAYRGFHAGLRRFLEDLDSVESESNANPLPTLVANRTDANAVKGELPPLTDFVKRLRSSGDAALDDKSKNPGESGTRRPRKRQNNDQLG